MIGDRVPKVLAVREGFDVRDASIVDFTLNSTKNQLKEYLSGSGTVEIVKEAYDRPKKIIEITHNLGYQPLFEGWCRLSGTNEWSNIPTGFEFAVGESFAFINCAMDRPNDNILQLHFYDFDIFGPEYTKSVDYQYIIYVDPYKDVWST